MDRTSTMHTGLVMSGGRKYKPIRCQYLTRVLLRFKLILQSLKRTKRKVKIKKGKSITVIDRGGP
jgi:hypothetical protein